MALTLSSTLPLLHTSQLIPRLGFGVYQSPPSTCVTSCLHALSHGYRHIDTAQFYRNEAAVGEAIRKSGLKRENVFITTKILAPAGTIEKTYEKCLESVHKIDPDNEEQGNKGYVDLFLIHSASRGEQTRRMMWGALERLVAEGRARTIGVSNYGVKHLEEMKEYAARWPPQVNQIELHPWCQQREVVSYCQTKGIVVQAYSPIVRGQKAHDPTALAISKKLGKTVAQVLIRYCLQKGWVPLPKSDTPSRIEENAGVYGWELGEKEMEELDGLDEGRGGAIVQAV